MTKKVIINKIDIKWLEKFESKELNFKNEYTLLLNLEFVF